MHPFCPRCGSAALLPVEFDMLTCQDCGETYDPESDYDNKFDELDPYDLADPDIFDAD